MHIVGVECVFCCVEYVLCCVKFVFFDVQYFVWLGVQYLVCDALSLLCGVQ